MSDFGNIGFSGKLRPSQVASSSIIHKQLESGEKELLIVAPPGSGKTVLGLYVWSDLVRLPTLVLSPNSAIQAQWIARAKELFNLDGQEENIGTDGKNPGILTSLTYQAVTMPKSGDENLDGSAMEIWVNGLIESGEAVDEETARAWILDLRDKNPDYYKQRLGFYRKKVRDDLVAHGNALWILHDSARKNLESLAEVGIGMIILDECHHLLDHWGAVLTEVRELFGNPVVLGLTATPPDIESADKLSAARYMEFFGDVDYEVPVPALVRDSNLSPYQDLAYFVRPDPKELEYIANVDKQFTSLIEELAIGPEDGDLERVPGLNIWLTDVLGNLSLPSGPAKDWISFQKRDSTLADYGRLYLTERELALPRGVPKPGPQLLDMGLTGNMLLMPLLDRYIRHGLMRSESSKDHELAEEAKQRLRLFGVQVTETGTRPCASPVTRVLAYASAKYDAVRDVLTAEMQALGPDIRAVVVTDFEKSSATTLVEGVLDSEAGGAIAVYRSLIEVEATDRLDPVLMTGSTVLVDDDLLERIMPRFEAWISEKELNIKLESTPRDGFFEIRGRGPDWLPRYYTEMITELFQEGVTKCLVGTRGLLGEGWDASRINVLVDLTTVTTSMSINQLRGRSFRLDKHWPEKVSNNWDIVCLAEEFSKGFDDYNRFKRKHSRLYGVCDDGAIEKGVGHVHPGFTEDGPEVISETIHVINEEMIMRARNRPRTRELWRIGEPFNATPREAFELKMEEGFAEGAPILNDPFRGRVSYPNVKWNEETLVLGIAAAVAQSLKQTAMVSQSVKVSGGDRGGGWMRTFLEDASDEDSKIFAEAMQQVLGPIDNPRYMISRQARIISNTWLSNLLPEVVGKYFRRKKNTICMFHTVPKVLAKKKETAIIFENNWNLHVGPGVIVYGHSESGRKEVQMVIQSGLTPRGSFHKKSVFT